MIGILSASFRIATRTHAGDARAHWTSGERFDNRKAATLEAHNLGQGHV